MAKKVEVVLNSSGIRELLHEVGSTVCMEKANQVADACGEEFVAEQGKSGSRTWGTVKATSFHAMNRNLKYNVVEKAIGGMK